MEMQFRSAKTAKRAGVGVPLSAVLTADHIDRDNVHAAFNE
jgi:hypothetical protein